MQCGTVLLFKVYSHNFFANNSSFLFVYLLFVKDQDVMARCTINLHWYPAQIIDTDSKNDFYFVHFYGWDDAYDEWLSAEDIRVINSHNSKEWFEDWTDSSSEMYYDDRFCEYNDDLVSYVNNICRTAQDTINHISETYLTLIMIILMFLTMVMLMIIIIV